MSLVLISNWDTQYWSGVYGPDGITVALPEPVYEVLQQVILAMARGQAVTIAPHNQRLTTQEAADILGIDQATLRRKRKQYGI